MNNVVVSGSFDDILTRDVRFLEEAANLGPLHVLLWSDEVVYQMSGAGPRFTADERKYFLEAVRYVERVILVYHLNNSESIPLVDDIRPFTWVVLAEEDSPHKRVYCAKNQINYHVIIGETLTRLPECRTVKGKLPSTQKKVIATGCFDWFHSGHIRFFEEISELGDLYVVLGHDENVRLLKGEGHPQFPQAERRYMVQSIRFVKQAMISSGHGWIDAEPEIELIKPDIYAVNEDGDKPEKRAFCAEHDLEYVVLKRLPKEGLPQRTSTDLRGF